MKKVEWLLVFGPNGFGWPMGSVANDACEFYFRAGIVILSLHGIAITVNNLDQSIYKKEFMLHWQQKNDGASNWLAKFTKQELMTMRKFSNLPMIRSKTSTRVNAE